MDVDLIPAYIGLLTAFLVVFGYDVYRRVKRAIELRQLRAMWAAAPDA